MRILIVAATEPEIAPLVAKLSSGSPGGLRLKTYQHEHHALDMLTTGVGMVATAAWCSRVLSEKPYDLALDVGVCGSFDSTLELGQVVHVVSDRISELGAEDDQNFLTIQEMKLLDDNEFPFHGGRLVNPAPPVSETLNHLTKVDGITVNTVHGNEESIASVTRRFRPQVESMEGAAFMYACLIQRVPFAQVRAVSNVVEKRNRNSWKMPEAISSLTEATVKILAEL